MLALEESALGFRGQEGAESWGWHMGFCSRPRPRQVPGGALDLFLFTVVLSRGGANCGIACLDLHRSQGYPGPWKFLWDDTKPCPTFNFFFF